MTALQLITHERTEQVYKHGFKKENDRQYLQNELYDAGMYILTGDPLKYVWPWSPGYYQKIMLKDRVGQLSVAGALVIADQDATGRQHTAELNKIVAELTDEMRSDSRFIPNF
jgi:hypothetical protein